MSFTTCKACQGLGLDPVTMAHCEVCKGSGAVLVGSLPTKMGWYSEKQRAIMRQLNFLNRVAGAIPASPALVYLTPDFREVTVTEIRDEVHGPSNWEDAVCVGPVLVGRILARLP